MLPADEKVAGKLPADGKVAGKVAADEKVAVEVALWDQRKPAPTLDRSGVAVWQGGSPTSLYVDDIPTPVLPDDGGEPSESDSSHIVDEKSPDTSPNVPGDGPILSRGWMRRSPAEREAVPDDDGDLSDGAKPPETDLPHIDGDGEGEL